MLAVGTRIDDTLEVEAHLGEGGLAQVFRVRDVGTDEVLALKVLVLDHPALRKRLSREGRIQSSLVHPHIVRVFRTVEFDEHVGLLMEFVSGIDLDQHLHAVGRMSVEQTLDVFARVVSALTMAHDAGVAHRDLKPANILLTDDAGELRPKIADFGIAKVLLEEASGTRIGSTMGTPGYLAPEQVVDASTADSRADIFAVGAMMYEAISGRIAHADPETGELEVSSTVRRTPPPLDTLEPSCPSSVVSAIHRAMEKDPAQRYQSIRSFASDVFADFPEMQREAFRIWTERNSCTPMHLARSARIEPARSAPDTLVDVGATPELPPARGEAPSEASMALHGAGWIGGALCWLGAAGGFSWVFAGP